MLNTEKIKAILKTVIDLGYEEEVVLGNYIAAINKNESIFQRNARQTAATLYYMVRRKIRKPMSFDEVNLIFYGRYKSKETSVQKYYKYLIRKLDIKSCKKDSLLGTTCMMPVKPSQVLPKVVNKLELDEKKKEIILENCMKWGKKTWKFYNGTGNNVYTYCSGLIYMAGILESIKITQREASVVCDVTEVGTRKHFQKISKFLEDDSDFSKVKAIIVKHLNHGNCTQRIWHKNVDL